MKLNDGFGVRGLNFFSNIPHMADKWPYLGNSPVGIKSVLERFT